MSIEHSPARQQRSRRIIRPREAWTRLGVGRSTFYEKFIATGRLKLVPLTQRARGIFDDELAAVQEEMAAARDQPAEQTQPPPHSRARPTTRRPP
jgi:predicted DNA-binding transcriptional regulator AlpA